MTTSSVQPGVQTRPFYGWIIVFASAWIYGISVVPTFCFGIFIKPLSEEFGWLRSEITGAFGLFMIVTGFMSIVAGLMVDRFGPRQTTLIGGSLLGIGVFLISRIDTLWQFYASYSVVVSLGYALIFVPLSVTIPRWFVRSRGLALGIFFAAAGVGGLIMSPALQHWITLYGWRISLVIVGIGTVVLIIPAALLLKKEPAEMELQPLGEDKISQAAGGANDTSVQELESAAESRDRTVGEAIRSSDFWIYQLSVVLMWTGIMMAQIHMVPYATDIGISATVAAFALGIASASNVVGRVVMGAASDQIGTKRCLCFSMILAGLALFVLAFIRQAWMLYCFAVMFGFAYGGVMPQGPKVMGSLFGVRFLGAIMGVGVVFAVMGPAIGPLLGALIHEHLGSYQIAFLVGGTSILIGTVLVLTLDLSGDTRKRKSGLSAHATR